MESRQAREAIEAQGIEGWCPPEQGDALFGLVGRLEAGSTVVELGSYKGLSTAWMGLASDGGRKLRLVSVDLHDPTYTERKGGTQTSLAENMQALDIRVDMIAGDTVDVASKALDYGITPWTVSLLYIDACHEYDSVKADFLAWRPMLIDEAHVVFDDYTEDHPGVIKFVDEMVNFGVVAPGQKIGHAYFSRLTCRT
jgi:MMP 1-O-methyltransferase